MNIVVAAVICIANTISRHRLAMLFVADLVAKLGNALRVAHSWFDSSDFALSVTLAVVAGMVKVTVVVMV
eukprot:5136169-Pyramimonas_sp.AAC.1